MAVDTATKSKTKTQIKEPGRYKVVYINDNTTTVDFVISTLVDIFNHTHDTATVITEQIHTEGSGVAATLPYEIAEQKGIEVTQRARAEGFPLVIKLETD